MYRMDSSAIVRQVADIVKAASAVLVTLDEEERIETASGAVAVVPAWRWLLRRD